MRSTWRLAVFVVPEAAALEVAQAAAQSAAQSAAGWRI
jgi:hypothetical protein